MVLDPETIWLTAEEIRELGNVFVQLGKVRSLSDGSQEQYMDAETDDPNIALILKLKYHKD
jgi:hypothetical protein